MTYRKLKADHLFDGYKMREPGEILVCREDGSIETITSDPSAREDAEQLTGILTPGFINCHCHLELSHLINQIPKNEGLVDFVLSVMRQRAASGEVKIQAARSAETAMYEAGIVAVGDVCNTADTADLKSEGRLFYYNFIELLGWDPGQAADRFRAAVELALVMEEKALRKGQFSLSPHAPYSISEALWQKMKTGFAGKTVSIHNQESAGENEFFLQGTGPLTRLYAALQMDISSFQIPGTSSVRYYLPYLKTAARIIMVHNSFMEEEDLRKAVTFSPDLYLCLCPNANLYIEDKLPDVPMFRRFHANLVLGTDSLASNHALSILEEMKTIRKVFPSLPTEELLCWATSNGAKALSFQDELGSFSAGKKPGIVLIENVPNGEINNSSTCWRLI